MCESVRVFLISLLLGLNLSSFCITRFNNVKMAACRRSKPFWFRGPIGLSADPSEPSGWLYRPLALSCCNT
ncbi:hypothetical protein BC939DRAFT_464566 [Gamsiella multidivaricata]|uniref:uncharacterized protein n=1 Tax=Gamsiella multidivaricata TaxID=101098 RepID=UPI002220FA23|nr:uncharacterized protein BC939DRAFT_464566 [Gamsiella multidivaricata]KAI7817838.1 hypothetical protein BC939DRAFT_464566 [Gamsiella multidivaricata]